MRRILINQIKCCFFKFNIRFENLGKIYQLQPTVLATMAPKTRRKNDGNATQNGSNDGGSSYFQKTVCLHDWWLVKAEKEFEGKRLAVAGSTSSELKAVRLFTSAPIVKRYDVFTLETADGICVCIEGFINRQRTNENGFSSEVFSHFYFGFPPYWEEYAKKCLGENFTTDIELEVVPNSSESDPSLISTSMVEERSNFDDGVDMNYSNNVTEHTTVAVDVLNGSNAHNHAANLPRSIRERINHSPSNIETNKVNVSPCIRGNRLTKSQVRITNDSKKKNSEVGCSTMRKDRASTTKVQNEQNLNRSIPSSSPSMLNHVKEYSLGKETQRKLDFEEVANSVSRKGEGKQSVISPKSLSLKCSRSGRVLLPPMEFWRNQIPVYDQNRSITGIKEEVESVKRSGSRSGTRKRRKPLS